MTSQHVPVQQLLRLMQQEYEEMPGLNLSKAQMQRMWALDPFMCDALIDALVDGRVLRRTVTGTYVIRHAGA